MPRKERDPIQELIRYALVAGGMVFLVLMLTRGKWLMGGLAAIWLLAIFVRLKRAAERD
ncbi:MAG: hypothetical protein QM776_17690 [Rhodocyclaceae bacterium]